MHTPNPQQHHIHYSYENHTYDLNYWQWGAADAAHVLVCVHGLTRQGRDFDVLARKLLHTVAQHNLPPLRIVCPDMPGRGASNWLPASGYQFTVYVQCIQQLLSQLHHNAAIAHLDWLGTSMGGLIGLSLSAVMATPQWQFPFGFGKFILNDIGPHIPAEALARIAQYVGQTEQFTSIEAAAKTMRERFIGFGVHSDTQWLELCRPMLHPHPQGGWQWHYDPAISTVFNANTTPEIMQQAEEALWHIYGNIQAPILLLRGAQSDILTRTTAHTMQQRHPNTTLLEFDNVGHAPTLIQDQQTDAVQQFLLF